MLSRPYKPYTPRSPGAVIDHLGSMILGSPKFHHFLFPTNIDTEFESLHNGLEAIRAEIGDALYETLRALAAEARPLFERDPDNKLGTAAQGRQILDRMQELLETRHQRKKR